MLTIRVTAFHGQAPAHVIATEFDETGGTIGRAPTNQMVLPDPDRHISRVHASVAMRNGQYILMDQGSANPIVLNGRALGNGVQAPLADGDELQIGDYMLRVSMVAPPPKASDTLFGEPLPAQVSSTLDRPVDDPLALFGGGAPAANPLAEILRPATAPKAAQPAADTESSFFAAPPAPGVAAPAGGIPADFDPFAEQYSAKPLGAEPDLAKLPDDLDLGLTPQPAGGQSIDDLFGLGPAGGRSPDPFGPGSALGEQPSQPNTAAAADPFAALGMPQQAAPAPLSDHVPEIQGSFVPPSARPEPETPRPAATSDPAMYLSWEGPAPDQAAPGKAASAAAVPPAGEIPVDPLLAMFGAAAGRGSEGGSGMAAAPQPTPQVPPRSAPPLSRARVEGDAGAAPRVPKPGAALAATPAAARASEDELLRAFLRGLGMPQLELPNGLSADTLLLIGLLLRESVQGTLDLLLARAMTKREIRAEVTMIVGRENNPLKFSPDVGVALTHLLTPQGHGFLAPTAAMRDAYDDLRAHTFGFMAGMRAALAGVLQRFDPALLEGRLTEKTVLDSLLPMNRRAKLWDLFAERYHEISQEAEDDFHTLFGKAFLEAYEEQVARLQDQADRK